MSAPFEEASALDVARRALLGLPSEAVLEVVDQLDLRAHTKITAVIGVPLKRLQQSRDVSVFALSAPAAAIKALLEFVSNAALERVVTQLGENADNPSYDELVAALDALVAQGMSDDEVVSVLAVAICEEFPASGHCRRLLAERERWTLPALPEREVFAPASPRTPRPEIKEQRKARREAQKQRKKPQSPPRPVKVKRPSPASLANAPATSAVAATAPAPRRRYRLTPRELERFNAEHPLVGSLVFVEVPFDAVDPEMPEVHSKERPALVVAASSEELLVRAIYSNPSATRSLFGPWRRLGLSHHSYLDDARVELRVDAGSLGASIGVLSDDEWNELI
ncbi:MAG TPA: hypothetical protein VNE22_00380 [Acidimicrobiales bacterium]|nr:hypothetical protein [Acidimicrobiales bacterium]HVB18721.1 hypothetical protein [Acidimicrobiales bacterium]